MNAILRTAVAATMLAAAAHASAQVTFYESEGFHGHTFTTQPQANYFFRNGFNDRASSVVVPTTAWKCAKTRASVAAAWCCVPADTLYWLPWA